MQQAVATEAKQRFGVEIRSFGIKQLGLPEEVTKAVFAAMAKSQESKAQTYQAEGEAKAQEIKASARATVNRILASANRKVAGILAEAEREVGQIYESFKGYEALRIYLDKLDALETMVRNRSTLILTTDFGAPIDLFNDQARIESLVPGAMPDTPDEMPLPEVSDTPGEGQSPEEQEGE
jgi:regulator of protease activity HflC (stomatin/prohibitin superfamily)